MISNEERHGEYVDDDGKKHKFTVSLALWFVIILGLSLGVTLGRS